MVKTSDMKEFLAEFEVPDLTAEQFVRLEVFKSCMAVAPDSADIQAFVSLMTDYILTGDQDRG